MSFTYKIETLYRHRNAIKAYQGAMDIVKFFIDSSTCNVRIQREKNQLFTQFRHICRKYEKGTGTPCSSGKLIIESHFHRL